MMSVCPICGKYHCIHWPEHWVYRRGQTYYCSAMCMDVDIVRDMNLLKQVRADRKKRKEAKKMEKMKKDGTPAKKPGPKKKDGIAQVKVDGALRIETPEANKIEIVETPENVVKAIEAPQLKLKPGLRGLNNSDFTVSAIKHPKLGEFYYDQKFNSVDWRSPEGEEISLHPAMWKELYMIIPDVMGILGVPDYE